MIRQFNRAATTYDQHCSVQQMIGEQALKLLIPYQQSFNHIADFGCGTGLSLQLLIKYLSFNHCQAIDFAESLLTMAKTKIPATKSIEWIQADFDQWIPKLKPCQLIFSNMALQWSSNIIKTIHLLQSYLSHQGVLLFTIPLANNFPELKAEYKPKFLDHQQVITLLIDSDWQLVTTHQQSMVIPFSNQLEALKALKATGTNCSENHIPVPKGLRRIKPEQFFIVPFLNQLTYHLGIYLVRKK